MSWLATLALLKDIVYAIRDILKRVSLLKMRKKIKKATKKAKDEGDQQGVEKSISDNAGEPTEHEYAGLHTRPAKKRR